MINDVKCYFDTWYAYWYIDMQQSPASRLSTAGTGNYKPIICHYLCKLELSIEIILYQDMGIQVFFSRLTWAGPR